MNINAWGPLCALLASVTWAVGSSTYSRLAQNHSALSVNFTRAAIALPVFLFLMLFNLEGFLEVRWSTVGWFSLSMLASYGLGDTSFILSSRYLGVPGALAIASIYPVYSMGVEAWLEGRWPESTQIAGLFIVIAGVWLVIFHAPNTQRDQARRKAVWRGFALALFTSFCWATNSMTVAKGGAQIDAVTANVLRMALALGVLAALQVLSRAYSKETHSFLLPVPVIRGSLGVFLFEVIAGSWFFTYGLSHSSFLVGATLTSLAPVLAVPIAWAMRLEKFHFWRTAGVFVTLSGIWLILIRS